MADIGLRVRSDSGYIETTVTTKLTKIIGKYTFPLMDAISVSSRWQAPSSLNGGLTVDDFSGGQPFYYFLANGQRCLWGLLTPSVTLTSNSISWNWVNEAVHYHVQSELFNTSTPQVNAVGGVILVYGIYS
jgi:hypothetical protein